MTTKSRRQKKSLIIVSVLTILIGIGSYFKYDIFVWFCMEEGNSAACLLVGKDEERAENYTKAKYYYKKSCDMDYIIACDRLGNLHAKQGNHTASDKFFKKSCKLRNESPCLGNLNYR
jgi:TPR repeat protein